MDLNYAKFIEDKMKLGKDGCPHLKGDVCFADPTNIGRCVFECCTNCRWLAENGIIYKEP